MILHINIIYSITSDNVHVPHKREKWKTKCLSFSLSYFRPNTQIKNDLWLLLFLKIRTTVTECIERHEILIILWRRRWDSLCLLKKKMTDRQPRICKWKKKKQTGLLSFLLIKQQKHCAWSSFKKMCWKNHTHNHIFTLSLYWFTIFYSYSLLPFSLQSFCFIVYLLYRHQLFHQWMVWNMSMILLLDVENPNNRFVNTNKKKFADW